MRNPYEVLGLKTSMEKQDVIKAFRNLSKVYHPDTKETFDVNKFHEINEAYNFIKKYNYDIRIVNAEYGKSRQSNFNQVNTKKSKKSIHHGTSIFNYKTI